MIDTFLSDGSFTWWVTCRISSAARFSRKCFGWKLFFSKPISIESVRKCATREAWCFVSWGIDAFTEEFAPVFWVDRQGIRTEPWTTDTFPKKCCTLSLWLRTWQCSCSNSHPILSCSWAFTHPSYSDLMQFCSKESILIQECLSVLKTFASFRSVTSIFTI